MAEVEFRRSTGGPDVTAPGGPATSSTIWPSELPTNAFDGNDSTRWAAASGQYANQWLAYDFGDSRPAIREVAIRARNDSGNAGFAPKSGRIEYSDDGTNWTTAWHYGPFLSWSNSQVRTTTRPGPDSHRYWRVLVRNSNLNVLGAGTEVQWRATPGGENLVGIGTPLEGTHYGSDAAPRAYDGNTSTFWASNVAPGGGRTDWLGYDFGFPVEIQEVSWRTRTGPEAQQAPTSGDIQWSDDGVSWATAWSFADLTWSSGSTNLITRPVDQDVITLSVVNPGAETELPSGWTSSPPVSPR